MSETAAPGQPQPTGGAREGYHHGRLREAMIAATLELVESVGPERWTMREAARRAGVSSGAPFRHFPNKTALMTAAAEEAIDRLAGAVETALTSNAGAEPLERFRILGRAYLDWVIAHPTHFKILSDRSQIEWSPALQAGTARIQRQMEAVLVEAAEAGRLRRTDFAEILLDARALSYGMARMIVDGQLTAWGVAPGEEKIAARRAFDRFVDGL